MTDALDEMFARDLDKLAKGLPSELAMNAAQVSAAQRDDKKGAEKPDLYAKGKGKGKDGKPAKDEENDERKSKGPNKGEKKDPNAPDKQQGAKSKDDMDKESGLREAYIKNMEHEIGKSNKQRTIEGVLAGAAGGAIGSSIGSRGAPPRLRRKLIAAMTVGSAVGGGLAGRFSRGTQKKIVEKLKKGSKMKKQEKKASLDEQFDADMRQIVGVDQQEHEDFDRPDVKIAGQTNDAIDDHFLGWMKDKADDDVVKEAGVTKTVRKMRQGTSSQARKLLKKRLAQVGAAGGAAGLAVGAGAGYAAGRKKQAELDKEAGVIENPENLDLLARIRRSAKEHVHGSADV